MKPGMDLLLAVLRGDPLPPNPDWTVALSLAQAENVLPWFIHKAVSLELPFPPAFAQARREAHLNAFLYTSELTSLLKSFAAAGISVLLLKGPSFAQRIYGDAALRPARDLDLLVRPEHFHPAQELLAALGFTPNYHPDDYHQSLSRNTVTVELHYDVENPLTFDFDTGAAWQQAIPTLCGGQPAFLFAPADEVLYLCLHGTRHRFDRLSYALDIALALERLTPATPTRVPGLENLQVLGTAMAQKLIPLSAPPPPGITPHISALAARLWHQVLDQPSTATDWRTMQRFYLEIEPTRGARLGRRLRQLRILTTRITESDRALAARLGLPHPWAARFLRPLRLLIELRKPPENKF